MEIATLMRNYNKNKCETLFKAFENKGVNDTMKKYGSVKLPIGQYTLSVYRYACVPTFNFLKILKNRASHIRLALFY